ncbi:MAG: trypsin-like peptidase domain-containing protein, partial [Kamptonema sp. SIO4C4]|nr:trypsin-like peptidase domain-containing protein [Kamptonema sp. SIO4C4]
KALENALLDAFRNHNALKRVVRFHLEENLENIAGSSETPLVKVVNNLVDWADSQGKIAVLLIGAYQENSGNPRLKAFYEAFFQKYYLWDSPTPPQDFGPDIDWRGPTESTELQGFWQSSPDWYDVGFLQGAIAQSNAVCRIEIPSQKITATGVLIAPQLILTNYHVLHPNDTHDLQANALDTSLQFGYISGEDEVQVFRLDQQEPILSSSPPQELDYLLLQGERSLCNAKIKPVSLGVQTSLAPRMGLNLLQHPAGESLKLSISRDGITGLYPEKGWIQYVNKAVGGSSGSPCFNDDWQLVALHHAEKSRSFGTIREGILLSSIYPHIQSFLS